MRRYYNKGSLVGGQVKLDKMGNNDGKISGEDFAVIRSKKMGGGMMKRPMYKKGSRVIPQDFMDTFIADDARSVAGKSGGADSGKAGEIRSKLGKSDVKFKKDIKNKIKKTKETIKKFAKKTKELLKAPIIAFHKKAEDNYKKYPDRRVRIYKDPRDKVKKANGGMMEEAKEINSKIKNSRTLKMGGGRVKRAAGGPGLYANIKAKKDRIAAGSGEKMRKVGSAGAPTAQNFINAAKTAKKV